MRRTVIRALSLIIQGVLFFVVTRALIFSMMDSIIEKGIMPNDPVAIDGYLRGAPHALVIGGFVMLCMYALAKAPVWMPRLVRWVFTDSAKQPSTVEQFRESWGAAMRGETKPVSELWKDANL